MSEKARCQYVSQTPWGAARCALQVGHEVPHAYSPSEHEKSIDRLLAAIDDPEGTIARLDARDGITTSHEAAQTEGNYLCGALEAGTATVAVALHVLGEDHPLIGRMIDEIGTLLAPYGGRERLAHLSAQKDQVAALTRWADDQYRT